MYGATSEDDIQAADKVWNDGWKKPEDAVVNLYDDDDDEDDEDDEDDSYEYSDDDDTETVVPDGP